VAAGCGPGVDGAVAMRMTEERLRRMAMGTWSGNRPESAMTLALAVLNYLDPQEEEE